MTTDQLVRKAVKLHKVDIVKASAKQADLVTQRDVLVERLHGEGMTYAQIAEELGCSLPYVQVMVQRVKGTLSPSRRPARKNGKKVVKHA